MFSDLNPLNRSTAILEIAIMLLGAALIGFFIAWILRKPKAQPALPIEKSDSKSKGQIAGLEKALATLKTEKTKLESDLKAANDALAQQKKAFENLPKGNHALAAKVAEDLKGIQAKYQELLAESKAKTKETEAMQVRLKDLGERFEKEKAAYEAEKAAAFARELASKQQLEAISKGTGGPSAEEAEKLKASSQKIRELQTQNFNLVTEIQKLKAESAPRKEGTDELDWVRKEKEGLEKEVEDLEGTIEQLQQENSDLRTQARDKASAGPVIEKLEKEKEKLKAEIDKLKKSSSPKKPLPSIDFSHLGKATLAEKDDLTRITGIGPVVEGKLNGLGIFSYAQIAKLKTADMDAIDELLQLFPGRVKRERWVQQATKLVNA